MSRRETVWLGGSVSLVSDHLAKAAERPASKVLLGLLRFPTDMWGESLAPGWWHGTKVARLPGDGVLLVATDLQGNWSDYVALKEIYAREKAQGNRPILLFCGDMVHGPSEAIGTPETWPDFLGTFYEDRSDDVILDFIEFSSRELAVGLLGNHEHAHVGGPVVSKFHADEAAVLNARLGDDVDRVRDFMADMPLIAVAPCGATFCHAAPRRTETNLEDFDALDYGGFDDASIMGMHESTTLGALLWSRYAAPEHARAFLAATSLNSHPAGFVAYGHDVVPDGYEKVGDEQICVSTSFGLDDRNKHYLRLDLSARYESVHDLRLGHELRRLYPDR